MNRFDLRRLHMGCGEPLAHVYALPTATGSRSSAQSPAGKSESEPRAESVAAGPGGPNEVCRAS